MGGVAVLHPQDCLKDHRDGLLSTAVKSRRKPTVNYSNSSPNLTRSDGRKRSPKNNRTTVDPPAPAPVKNLVMGQVKILKRGEALDESSTVLKGMNDRNVLPAKESAGDRKVSRDAIGGRRVLPAKKKTEKRSFSNSNPNPNPNPNPRVVDILKVDDFALSSTDRLGPDPEMVPKQMKKNITELVFAGSAFVDSPPPSSLPLPGFFTKNFVAADPSSDLRRMLGLSLS